MIGIGQTLGGKYRLVRLLGDGGMGSVFEAVHERLGNRVAIKIVHPDIARRPGIVDRFLQEAKVAAQIKSPHVVQVSDVDQTPEGLPYMVMELLEGEPLGSVLVREQKLPVPTACGYAAQVLEGLEAAHAIGVVHRDLKPDNIFVTFIAQKPVIKLIDFGIAKVRREDQRNLTVAGITMGTAEYMPPEQAFSADKADARSDLYSVGVLLYEMLSGQRPVTGEDARAVAMKVERGEVKPLVHAAPEVPQRLAGLCHRAMAPRQEMRFASATEMRLALEDFLAGRAPSVPDAGAVQLDPRLQSVPATTTTVRAGGPLPGADLGLPHAAQTPAGQTPVGQTPFESTQRTPPMNAGFVPPMGVPPNPARSGSERPRRRRGGATWLLVALPVLLGAAVVVALVATHQDGSDTPVPTTTTTTTTTTTAATSAATSTGTTTTTEPLPTLRPTTYVPPVVTTRPAGDASTPTDGAPSPSTTSPFPPFPSSFPPFPFPMPSGSVFQIPSGLPPFFPAPPPT